MDHLPAVHPLWYFLVGLLPNECSKNPEKQLHFPIWNPSALRLLENTWGVTQGEIWFKEEQSDSTKMQNVLLLIIRYIKLKGQLFLILGHVLVSTFWFYLPFNVFWDSVSFKRITRTATALNCIWAVLNDGSFQPWFFLSYSFFIYDLKKN